MKQIKDAMTTRSNQHDRPRSVRITERDVFVVNWLAEQYAAPVETLALLLGDCARTTVQTWLTRMRRCGWIHTHVLLGRLWVWPTAAGLHGCEHDDWRSVMPPVVSLAHLDAVGRVRLWFARTKPHAMWLSERRIRHMVKESAITPDGILYDSHGATAVQVERTLRDPQRYAAIVDRLTTRCSHVIYVCADSLESTLRRHVQDRPTVSFMSLDTVLNGTLPRWRRSPEQPAVRQVRRGAPAPPALDSPQS